LPLSEIENFETKKRLVRNLKLKKGLERILLRTKDFNKLKKNFAHNTPPVKSFLSEDFYKVYSLISQQGRWGCPVATPSNGSRTGVVSRV
jgi:hypothetical protein